MIKTTQYSQIGYVAASAIKIASIPHLSILCSDDHWQNANERFTLSYKEDMRCMLYELYQHYKMRVMETHSDQKESVELLWVTKPVINQPYKANINVYLIIRSIQNEERSSNEITQSLLNICTSSLNLDRYKLDVVDVQSILDDMSTVCFKTPKAIVKAERIDAINTTPLKACFAYDILPKSNVDLSKFIDILIQHPDCAVSMQLLPAYFLPEELAELNAKNQVLGMLVNGVSVQGVGNNVQVESAKRAAFSYRYYKEHSEQPVFFFNIVTYADTQSGLEIIAKLMGQLNIGQDTSAALSQVLIENVNPIRDFMLSPWLIHNYLDSNSRDPNVWNSGYVPASMRRLSFMITDAEACEFFRLPIGNEFIGAGMVVNETGSKSKMYAKGILNDCELPFGKLKSSPNGDIIGLRLIDLAKHMLIVGTPGSGKTNFSIGLLRMLWLKYKIPFIVIEPAKNEYRALIQNIPELQVFTPGKNSISPFVFNPFIPPENVKLEAYKSILKTAFAAGVTMASPLDKIFEDTIDNCYSKYRWLNSYTKDDKGIKFNISDFVKCFEETFNAIGYTGDSRNIGRAGLVRLQGLTKLFDNYHSIPIQDLLTKPTVIELAAIENSDEKALYIALILLSILSYVNGNYVGEGDKLRNFILVEEAHVLLDSSSNGGEGAANPSAIAQGLVKRMLAEIRSYGVGLGIADQSPRKVGTDIIALTDVKLGFRLVEKEDREILADSVSMDSNQMSRLAKLKPGESFLFFNKMSDPEEILTPENRNSQGYRVSLSDEEIAQLSTYWKNNAENLRPYPECEKSRFCGQTCNHDCRLLSKEIAKRIIGKYRKSGLKVSEQKEEIRSHFTKLIKQELNGEEYSDMLRQCVWIHIYRGLK